MKNQISNLTQIEDLMQVVEAFAAYSPVGVQFYDGSGHCLFVNETFNKIFGSAPPPGYNVLQDELVAAAGTLHFIHNAFAGNVSQLPLFWYDARQLQNLSDADVEYVQKFGKKCAIETTMIPVFGKNRQVTHVIFIYKDVTAELFMQEEKEKALKERDDIKAMIDGVLNETQAVIYIKDFSGKFIFVNGQFCRIFAKSVTEILGKTDYELFPRHVADQFRKNDLEVKNLKNSIETEEVAVHADGTSHTYLSLKFLLNDSAGVPYGICGISTDITQHRRMEQELGSAKRMESVGILASGIAHDFNNVIEIILLVADTLNMTGAKEKPEWKTLIDSMTSSAQSAALLTRQLLAFGRKQTFKTRVINPGSVVQETAEILKSAFPANISFSSSIGSGLWPVLADPLQVEQILTNLCFNARDAMPDGGKLSVSVKNISIEANSGFWRIGKPEGDFVLLEVLDTGAGIAAVDLEKIFEPYFTTKVGLQRSGLGLATVYGIVQAAKGDISVESTPGKGSCFRIILPRSEGSPSPEDPVAPEISVDLRGTESILLVEDQAHLREITAKLLKNRGYQVVEAESAEKALEIWNNPSIQIDLVLTDIVMPKTSGPEMVQRMLSRSTRNVKILFVSAYSDKPISAYNFDPEIFRFIEKPYTGEELLKKIREVCEIDR